MPPLTGIDRGLNGEALKALEESGHGRRLAIVDASYNIPRWAQVVDYRGESSAHALKGILALVPTEGYIEVMEVDPESDASASEAYEKFDEIILNHSEIPPTRLATRYRLDEQEQESARYEGEDEEEAKKGFYSIANNQEEDTLFVRTADRLPYACVTFLIGHSQTPDA